jgi:hypothetical protein
VQLAVTLILFEITEVLLYACQHNFPDMPDHEFNIIVDTDGYSSSLLVFV